MLLTYDYSQLDPATKAYLRDVRAMKGHGAPGMFFGVGSSRPIWAMLFGVFVLGFFLWIASTSTKAPWAVAALQTSAILMGGWLILYAFRRWLANTENFAGWFFYFDPVHAYIGEGESIRIAALPADTEITPNGATAVQFMTQHDGFSVALPTRSAATSVADYYASVDWVTGRQEGPWVGIPLVEVGGVAKYLTEEDAEPPSMQDCGLRLDSLPEEVTSVRKPKSGIFGYLAVIGIGAVLFGLFSAVNPDLQDDRNFENAKEKAAHPEDADHKGAQGFRDYLLNPRNTKHRVDATSLLAALYDEPIGKVKLSATDPTLRDGMVALLESLRGPDSPAVSIEVTDKTNPSNPPGPMAAGLRSMISDGISKACGGKEMIGFVEKPRDVPGATALIDIKYTPVAGQFGQPGSVDWWVELRLKPEDEKPFATQKGRAPVIRSLIPIQIPNFGGTATTEDPLLPSAVSNDITDAVYRDVMMKIVGTVPEKAKVVWEGD